MAQKLADLVIINGKVITVDKHFSIKQAVAVKDGKIVAVGKDKEVKNFISRGTKVLDIQGKPMLPGINDSHMHGVFFGGTMPPLALDLRYPTVKSIRDISELVRKRVESTRRGEWIPGFGWDPGYLEECKENLSRFPTRWDIDPVSPNHPTFFIDFSGHTLLANSEAIRLAGITKDTPNPPGGEIEKDPNTGEVTGIFKELSAQALVSKAVPLYTKGQKREAILSTIRCLNAEGITSYTDAALGPGGDNYSGGLMGADCIDVYKELCEEEKLTARVTILMLFGEYGALSFDDLKKGLAHSKIPEGWRNEWLRIPGVKIFADGIPPTKTAWMYEEYVGGSYGSLCVPGKTDEEKYNELVNMIVYSHKLGVQIGVHATGGRAIDATVDGFIKAMQEKKLRGNPRHYIIHGDFISEQYAKRMAEHSIGVNVQPGIKWTISEYMDTLLGKDRSARQWPLKMLIKTGVHVAASSDAPVTYPNWRQGVQSAILREAKASGEVSGPEYCITIEEAIRMYTISGAWQDHMEKIKGSVEVGKLADFCILGEDILTIDPHKIKDIPVLMTVAGGKIVYNAGEDFSK
jgi:predicted amidohydrolase YtcJ